MEEGERRDLEAGVDPADRPEAGATWAEQLARARREAFVGRGQEVAALANALRQAADGPRVVSVTGPGGIGKTTLCRRFADDARAAGHETFWLSGDELPANAQLLEAALVGQGATQAWKSLGTRAKADLLVLDAFERLQPLVLYLLRTALPASGPRLLVLVSSREKLPDVVTAEVGAVLADVPLRAFGVSETARALERARIPQEAHEAVHAFTKGHPLAVALTVEHLVGRATMELDASITNDVIAGLVRTFEREIPDEASRSGLHALCLVPLDDGLLAAAVGQQARPSTVGSAPVPSSAARRAG